MINVHLGLFKHLNFYMIKKKTIYYDNAVIKIYDIPIFYFPKFIIQILLLIEDLAYYLLHFLTLKPYAGLTVPYFLALGSDKNLTLYNRFYDDENPLFFIEYNQAFKNSNMLIDFGYTEGYKKKTATKSKGEKSHFFSQFTKSFKGKDDSINTLNFSVQEVSNDKYLKLYRIKSNLVDFNTDTLESSLNFTHEKEDLFLGINASVYETLKGDYEDKYEYILPELTFDKNLYNSENLGNFELQSNLKVHNYDTINALLF